jgi:NAD(P)H dehydrogenase (quinone)
MILVTGAAGKTGRAIIRALSARGEAVRALVHRPEQAAVVEELGARRVVVGDLRSQAVVNRSAQDVRAVYHICPNMSPDEVAIGQAVIAAARTAGAERFVYHSVLHPHTESMSHHWHKLRVEELLFESELAYTILQPAAYMQNVLAHWEQIVTRGVFPVPYAVKTRLSMVDLEDVATVATMVLIGDGHLGAIYELAGSEVLSQVEVAGLLAEGLGRPVRAEAIPLDAWERDARQAGLDDYRVRTLVKMFGYYESYGFWGNPRVLGWLLGRPPTSFGAFVERTLRGRLGVRALEG